MQRKTINYAKYGYIFSIPFALAFLIFSLYPLIYTIVIGFTDLKGLGKTDFQILENPFANFQTILASPTFQTAFKNTFVIWLMNFIPQMLLALLLTAWFTHRRFNVKGQGAFKVLFYMPNIITAATIAVLFGALFTYPTGPVNYLLQSLGQEPFQLITSKWGAKILLAFIQFWMWYGYTMLILISGVLGMSPDIFEAADIDGATGPQTFFYITLPNLRTIMLYTLVTSAIGGINMFDMPRLLIQGGMGNPDNATLTTSLFIFLQAFSGGYMYNRAAAASLIMFVVILVLSGVIFFSMRDRDEARMKKAEKLAKKAARGAVK